MRGFVKLLSPILAKSSVFGKNIVILVDFESSI